MSSGSSAELSKIQVGSIVDYYFKEFADDIEKTTQQLHALAQKDDQQGLLKFAQDSSVAIVKIQDPSQNRDLVYAFHPSKIKERLELYAECGKRKRELAIYNNTVANTMLTEVFFKTFSEKEPFLGEVLKSSPVVKDAMSLVASHVQLDVTKIITHTLIKRPDFSRLEAKQAPKQNKGGCSVQ